MPYPRNPNRLFRQSIISARCSSSLRLSFYDLDTTSTHPPPRHSPLSLPPFNKDPLPILTPIVYLEPYTRIFHLSSPVFSYVSRYLSDVATLLIYPITVNIRPQARSNRGPASGVAREYPASYGQFGR